jgi:RNA polymerase sigma factor (sigma-70 family)
MEASAARRPSHPGPRVPARLLRLASDERLVDYVRHGSEPAFEAVFDRHHRAILAFCRHMLGSPEEAEDAVQHVFMAAFRSLVGSDRAIQLRPWLFTIARNRCLSVLRARREKPVEDLDELPTENLSAEVQRRQDLRDLVRDVAQLPEEQRAALVLAEVGGVSHDEIAQVMGVQRDKVKALVFQARSSLIASRSARDTPCDEIRAQLAELRGGALRRNTLRRHLSSCAGCREFRTALQDQRKMLAIALPVVPTIALKQGVMAGALGSSAAAAGGTAATGGAAGAVAGGSLLSGGGAAVTAKVLAVAAIAGGGALGVKEVVPHEPAATRSLPSGASGGADHASPRGKAASRGGTSAPDALGSKRQRAGERPAAERHEAAGRRRSEERSKGRRGIEQRSERAAERAAGPKPEHTAPAKSGPSERALERRDARAPEGGSKAPEHVATPGSKIPVKPEKAPNVQAQTAPKPEHAPKAEQAPKLEQTTSEGAAPAPMATTESADDGAPAATPTPVPAASGKGAARAGTRAQH